MPPEDLLPVASAKLNSRVPPRSQIRQLEKVLEIRVGRSSLASSNFALGAFGASFIRRSLSVDFYIFAPPNADRWSVHSKLRPCSATTIVTIAVMAPTYARASQVLRRHLAPRSRHLAARAEAGFDPPIMLSGGS